MSPTSESVNESLREKFESAWIDGEPVLIEHCLPDATDPSYLPTLEELVLIEMEFRWDRRNENTNPTRVEEYVQKFKELDSGEILVRLIEQEIQCRKKANDQPTINEYRERFPTIRDRLDNLTTIAEGHSDKNGTKSSFQSGETFGRYVLNDRQGEGGFGLVWQADDPKLGRRIAIKQLSRRLSSNREQRQRFISEARIAARLEHPGIVPVYDVEPESETSQPYYTMKLVAGETLEDSIRRFHRDEKKSAKGSVERMKLLNVFYAICRTMQYAHDHGVIHRDLKPQNIILGDYGETIILDWGLAKIVQDPANESEEKNDENPDSRWLDRNDLTQAGAVMGTPAYMSPEQADGRIRDVDERSDVYSLGVMLFQILTGEFPFEASTTAEMIQKVLQGNPRTPRSLDRSVPGTLQSICLKAMQRNLRTRYQSVSELADDMERYLADEPVAAHADTLFEKSARWARKNRRWVSTAAAMLTLLTVGSTVSAFMINEQRKIANANEIAAAKSAEAEKEAKLEEQKQRKEAQWQLARSYVKDGQRHLDDIDVISALLWYNKALQLEKDLPDQERVHRIRLNSMLRRIPRLEQIFFAEKQSAILDVQYSTDEKSAIILQDDGFRRRDLESGELVEHFDFGFKAKMVRLSKDQKFVAVATRSVSKPEVAWFEIDGGKKLWQKAVQKPKEKTVYSSISKLEIAPKSDRIAVFAEDGRLRFGTNYLTVFNTEDGNPVVIELKQESRLGGINFSPDGKQFVTSCWDNSASVWNSEDGKLVKRLDMMPFKPASVRIKPVSLYAEFSPDGKWLATSSSYRCFFWDTEKFEKKHEVAHGFESGMNPEIKYGVFSESGETFSTVDGIHRVRTWKTATGEFVNEFSEHEGTIHQIEYFKNSLVLSCSRDGTTKFWNPKTGQLVNAVVHHADEVVQAHIDSSGYKFLTRSNDQTIRFWNSSVSQLGSATKSIKPAQILVQKFAATDKYFATFSTGRGKHSVDIWDAETYERIGKPISFPDTVSDIYFDPSGQNLLVNCSINNMKRKIHFVQMFDAATAEPASEKLEHAAYISASGFFKNGQLFTASHDKTLVIWDVEESKQVHQAEHEKGINTADLSSDEKWIVTGSQNKEVRIFDASDLSEIGKPVETGYGVTKVEFHPNDNDILVSGYATGTQGSPGPTGETVILRRTTGKLWELTFQNDSYFPAKLRADGKYFLNFGDGKKVVVYEFANGKKLAEIEHRKSVLSSNFHPKLSRVVTAAEDKVVRIWDIETGQPVSPVFRHIGIPAESIFDPSGNLVITRLFGSNVVRSFDSNTGETVTLDMNYSMFPEPIRFTHEGKRLFVGGNRPLFWNFEKIGIEEDKLQQLCELLAARKIDEVGALIPLSTEEIRERWDALQLARQKSK